MENLTSASQNATLMFSYKVDDFTRTVFLITTMSCFTFFFYFIVIMLKVFFTTPHIQENPRYVLFVHMLINDTLYIIFTNFMVVSFMHAVYFPMVVCFIINTLTGCSFLVTPYNLALMSLERYIAICFPLRHLQFCTPKKVKYAIAGVWIIGSSLSFANFIMAMYFAERTSYSLNVVCDRQKQKITPIQNVIRSLTNILSFTMVALIIIFTYINVMLVARRIGSGGSSALKAGKTVMLHAFQLILCMVAFISTVTEAYVKNYLYYLLVLNYVLFTCVPRFLSPLIYGVRDEVFQKHIRKYCTITHVCRPQRGLEKL
ncbi:odorant receptor 131-2-like [Bufo gargarizans]|uniref:odorant receptor 131-2-like n=1 Tax=Bufo gargarizans TaxID=30331 RepID=UPI001CF371A6|nr:odorant receptor 131-2-like [Bufo gargarizans]